MEWAAAFGFTCAEERASAYASTGEQLVWIPASELDPAEVSKAARHDSVVFRGRAKRNWPFKGTGSLVILRRGAPMGVSITWPILDKLTQFCAARAEQRKTSGLRRTVTQGDDAPALYNQERAAKIHHSRRRRHIVALTRPK